MQLIDVVTETAKQNTSPDPKQHPTWPDVRVAEYRARGYSWERIAEMKKSTYTVTWRKP